MKKQDVMPWRIYDIVEIIAFYIVFVPIRCLCATISGVLDGFTTALDIELSWLKD